MTIFSKDTPEAVAEKGLYEEIKKSMAERIDEWRQKEHIKRLNTPAEERWNWNTLPDRDTMIKLFYISLQYVWLKLGYSMPDLERRLIDEEGNITLEL